VQRTACGIFTLDNPPADGASNRIADSGNNRTGNDTRDFKKTKLKPHLRKQWCIPPKQNAEFAAKMEDVLEVYAMEYDEEMLLWR